MRAQDPDTVASGDGSRYDDQYYRWYHTGEGEMPYERNEHWLGFFSDLADQIVARLAPTSVLDVGCALGMLVEALVERGVDAHGIDVSDFAIEQARAVLGDRVRVASAAEPLDGWYDLVVSIETIEHIAGYDAVQSIAHMAAVTDTILLSTTPGDFDEPTHVNVQPVEHWAGLLAEHGFVHDLDFDASFVTPWAGLFRRLPASTTSQIVRAYERDRWRLRSERDVLRAELQRVWEQTHQSGAVSGDAIRHDLRVAIDAARAAEASEGNAIGRLRHVEYALAAAKEREKEMVDLLAAIDERATRAAKDFEDLKASKSFRLFWALITPYRKLRERR